MSHPNPRSPRTSQIVASMLGEGHDVRIRLSGWSMKPLLRSGATLCFSPESEPAVGDIALVRHGDGTLVAHRIVAVGSDWVETKGDSCLEPDGRIPLSCLLGCAVSLHALVTIPLRNPLARGLGRVVNRFYPPLVGAYRTLFPRRDLAGC